MAGKKINKVLGDCISAINDETKITDERLNELESRTFSEYVEDLIGMTSFYAELIERHPELKEVNWLDVMNMVDNDEIELD